MPAMEQFIKPLAGARHPSGAPPALGAAHDFAAGFGVRQAAWGCPPSWASSPPASSSGRPCSATTFPTPSRALSPRDRAVPSARNHLLAGHGAAPLVDRLETDVRLLRNLGRTAFGASVFGMIVPFVFGFALGWFMPEQLRRRPRPPHHLRAVPGDGDVDQRHAGHRQDLLDLDLTRRNIGVVILSAGVVDDTTGWLILVAHRGAATGDRRRRRGLAFSLGGTGTLPAAFRRRALPDSPVRRWLLATIGFSSQRHRSRAHHRVLASLLAAHRGASTSTRCSAPSSPAASCVRCRLRAETLHRLESVTLLHFRPVFFGLVGLKVDLRKLGYAQGALQRARRGHRRQAHRAAPWRPDGG